MIDYSQFKGAESVFRFFAEISKIPRASGNTGPIADYLMNFAKERGLWAIRDSADNVIIRKKATVGRESSPAVIFQGHTDMVPAWIQGSTFNFEKDALDLYIDGDFLKARGTTLGGDDGIAVAYALAVLDSNDISHPDFEAVFTSDEETGLIGAKAIDPDNIKGRLLVNIDSDAEGIFTAGCAGGLRSDITLPLTRESCSGVIYKVEISGLLGGHSGVEIDKGRTNAIKLLCEILSSAPDIRLIRLAGGNADNAIPSAAYAVLSISDASADIIKAKIDAVCPMLSGEPGAKIEFTQFCNCKCVPMSKDSTDNVLSLIRNIPTGVVKMSDDIPTLVETSLNIGIAATDEEIFRLSVSIRSAKGEEKTKVAKLVSERAGELGASVREHSAYPAWEYKKESVLRDVMCKVYKECYGKDAEVVIIHAGLECGIFSDKIEGLDCVSIGPDNFDIHTPDERLSISSSIRVWEYLIKVLGAL